VNAVNADCNPPPSLLPLYLLLLTGRCLSAEAPWVLVGAGGCWWVVGDGVGCVVCCDCGVLTERSVLDAGCWVLAGSSVVDAESSAILELN
jgi:hypothetical protein